MTQSHAQPMFAIPAVYLIREKGESTDRPVKKLQAVLEQHWPGLTFIHPDILFNASTGLQGLQSNSRCGHRYPKVPCWSAWV